MGSHIMDVSIIIVNYKTSGLIRNCVRSIMDKTHGLTYEVIIVDNNSESNFKETILEDIAEDKSDLLRFIALPENIGFGRANNEGVKVANGRNIFFLNPDTLLINNAIEILSSFLDNHPKVGACGGNLINGENKPSISFKRYLPGIFWELDDLLNTIPQKIIYGKSKIYNFSGKPINVGFISGADLMVKKEVLDSVGVFSPDFFMYFEETDLCTRIKKAGWKIMNVPEAKICHLESKSFSETTAWESEFKTTTMEESRKIYYRKNNTSPSRFIADLLHEAFLRTRFYLLKDPTKKSYYKLRLNIFKNQKSFKEKV